MKKILFIVTLLFLVCPLAYGQFFEGTLTYSVKFDVKTKTSNGFGKTKEQTIEEKKKSGELYDTIKVYIKGGNYLKSYNSKRGDKIIYKSNENRIYRFEKNNDYVIITDAKKYFSLGIEAIEPKIKDLDSVKIINNITCKGIKLFFDKEMEEYYFYNNEVAKLNSKLFVNHNYEWLNTVTNITNSYPIEIIRNFGSDISIKITLVSISEEKVDDAVFKLPKLKKVNNNFTKSLFKTTGSTAMKIQE